ncbi:MAG: restriction endonuclease [Oleiphilus sp.]|nr:MAG: restriction endonuclease [Oleiphilus sp.]
MTNMVPSSWESCEFGDIAKIRNGYAFKSKDFKKGKELPTDIPLVKQSQLVGSKIDLSEAVYLAKEFAEDNPSYLLKKGDILIGMSGSIGKLCYYEHDFMSLQNQRTGKIEIFAENYLHSKYLGLYLSNIENELVKKAKGMGVQNISAKDIEALAFPLPPFNEQKRIVAKIEELFSELDNGIAALKTAREQLKVYRQAVLKHAFEGKLTAQWREDNADKLESPEQLLTRIQQEREARYQQQMEDWKAAVKEWEANGKEGKKPGKPKKLEPQGDPDGNYKLKLELPDIWSPCCIGQAYSVYVGATPSRKEATYWNGDIFWVSSGEVSFCEITDTAEKITESGYENTSTEIHPPGTVLLAMIGEGKTRGQAAITHVPAAHNQNTAAIRVSEAKLSPEYLYHFLQYQYEQTRRVGSGNNQKALNKARVSSIEFPLCSNAEQLEVVARLSEKLSVVESIEREIDDSLARSETLRQSILKKAFSGQLVSQDPSDKPASELLARIQAERETPQAKAGAKPKPAKKRERKSKERA